MIRKTNVINLFVVLFSFFLLMNLAMIACTGFDVANHSGGSVFNIDKKIIDVRSAQLTKAPLTYESRIENEVEHPNPMLSNLFSIQTDPVYVESFQLTHNDVSDTYPSIHNGMVTWMSGYSELILYDGTSQNPIPLPEKIINAYYPDIDNGMVVFRGLYRKPDLSLTDGVFFYDGASTVEITNDEIQAQNIAHPKIQDGKIAWAGLLSSTDEEEVFLYDGISVIQITGVEQNDIYLDNVYFDQGKIAWIEHFGPVGVGGYEEVFYYDGTTTIQLTDHASTTEKVYRLDADDGWVTWSTLDGIYVYDGLTIQKITDSLTSSSLQIDNGKVAWIGSYPREIFVYDGSSISPLTDDAFVKSDLQFHDGMLSWLAETSSEDTDVFFYNGISIVQLTDVYNVNRSPKLHNGMVTWYGVSDSSFEIFITVPDETPPTIDQPEDVIYEEGTIGHKITWDPFDPNPVSFQITRNGLLIDSDLWAGEIIEVDVDDLSPGRYSFVCEVIDGPGFSTSDEVVVFVNSPLPSWVFAPTDQIILSDEPLLYQLAAVDSSGIYNWWFNDSVNFNLITSYYDGGSTSLLVNNTILEEGVYGVEIVVTDFEGYTLTGRFNVIVVSPPSPQVVLKLSGSFDYLEKEKINLQLAGLLTEKFSGEPVSGAKISFTIYNPTGIVIYENYLLESTDPLSSGVYVFKHPLTIDQLKYVFHKGIYWVYARATTVDGLKAVDMIQFHIDPPSESSIGLPVWLFPSFVGVVILLGVSAGGFFLKRRF